MRFKTSNQNLTIYPDPESIERVVLALADVVVPKWAEKLCFCSRGSHDFPVLQERHARKGDLTIIDPRQRHQVVQRFRVVNDEQAGEMRVAAPRSKVTREGWKTIAAAVQARLK
jgi:hypothetical protein